MQCIYYILFFSSLSLFSVFMYSNCIIMFVMCNLCLRNTFLQNGVRSNKETNNDLSRGWILESAFNLTFILYFWHTPATR